MFDVRVCRVFAAGFAPPLQFRVRPPPQVHRSRSTTTVSPSLHAASLDRLDSVQPVRAAAAARRSTASSSTPRRRPPKRNRREVARLEGRQCVERCREGERLVFVDAHIADVRRVDRLHAALAQRVIDRARDQIVRDVVQDLVLKRCLTTRAGALPGRKPGMRALRE